MSAESQKLGFSSFSPYGGSNVESDHTMFYNVGEMLNEREDLSDFSVHDGLLQSRALSKNYESYLEVKFFLDDNENGLKDAAEKFISLGAATINGQLFLNYSKEGLLFVSPVGTYDIVYDPTSLPDWNLTTPSDVTIDMQGGVEYEQVLFGLSPETSFSDLQVVISSERFRCFSPVDYVLSVCNFGTVSEFGIVWLQLDERLEEFYFDQEPDHVSGDHLVGWNFDLGPTEKLELTYMIIAPAVSEDLPPGEIFKSVAYVEDGFNQRKRDYCYEQELRCSWDPNDKLVVPNRPDSLGLIDQPLAYTLRFQNTGNDYAENVVVTDTLSEYLDMNTFQLIATSHPEELKVEYTKNALNILDFRFDNIYLPDSTENLEGSNGFISYTIKVKEGVALGTEINNTGFIYFDFNPAVVTNTTGTTMVDMFPIVAVDDEPELLSRKVFPNPSTGIIYLEDQVEQVNVIDLSGRLLSQYKSVSKMNLSGLLPGTYFLEIKDQGTRSVEKIILTR